MKFLTAIFCCRSGEDNPPSPAKTKDLRRRKPRFLLPLPQAERISLTIALKWLSGMSNIFCVQSRLGSSPLEAEDAKTWAYFSKPLVFAGEWVSRSWRVFLFLILLGTPGISHAGTAEVRDVALSNNCPPKKIEIFQQPVGTSGSIIYRVQCVLPKTVGKTEGDAKLPDALLVSCVQNLCDAQQPVMMETK